jgi:putative NIF3 family GTP cyclohydrolase 1 type 2
MDLMLLTQKLDSEFNFVRNGENLVEFAVTENNRQYIHPDFLKRRTGLVVSGSKEIQNVYTTVFVSDGVVEKICREGNCLLFTHHHFNYYEDERGLQAISSQIMDRLSRANVSVYVAHAPLDTHPQYGTSLALAQVIGISADSYFYDYFGSPVALIGHIEKVSFDDFARRVQKELKRPHLTLQQHSPYVEKLAVVAGGGDVPDLLQQAHDSGCDTLLTGTVEHRWAVPLIQDLNRRFHELNSSLKLNLIGGTHFGTERPAMIAVTRLLESYGIPCSYCEDETLLNAV